MRWYRLKFVAALILLIILEEATPFVPLIGLVVLAGCFAPRCFLGIARCLLRYYDARYGTSLSSRIPTHAAIRSAQTESRRSGP